LCDRQKTGRLKFVKRPLDSAFVNARLHKISPGNLESSVFPAALMKMLDDYAIKQSASMN
jgi:hypothetical protein